MTRFLPLIAALCLFAASVALYAGLLFGIRQSISAATLAHASASTTGEQQLFKRRVASFMEQTASVRSSLEGFIATDESVISLINEIDNAGKREHLSITIGSVGTTPSVWKYHEPLEIVVTAQGSFSDIVNFATDLESLPEASRLATFRAESTDKKDWFATYTVYVAKERSTPQPPAKTP
ncbi:MAG: hypothetical protein JO026_02145 [Patescibacteria group bacterium]|nr:hypothetical protein [Patescibacteria group bacterium]